MMESTPRKHDGEGAWKERIVRYAIGMAVILVVYLLLILAYVYPHWPSDPVGWAILIFVGVPVSFCLEMVGGNIFSLRSGQRVSSKGFSGKRVGIALMVVIAIAGGLFFLWSELEPFIRPHFK